MSRSYLKMTWRSLVHNKAFSAINIAGLALGLTCSLLIILWVQDEKKWMPFIKTAHSCTRYLNACIMTVN